MTARRPSRTKPARKAPTRRNPDRAITPAAARALGVTFGRAAAEVERRQEQESAPDERRTPAEFRAAVEELAWWEMGESGHPARWHLEHRKVLQRAFYAGARSAAKAPARRKAAPKRNPAARKYRDRQYEVAEWNVRAQRWEPLGRVMATSPKYAIEEFMASRPGYSRLHLRAEEIKTAPRRNPALSASEAREHLRAEIREWGTSREDVPVGLWSPIAKAAKVSASEMRGVAEVASVAAYNARHGQAAPRAAMQARREIAEALVAQVDAATDAQVLAYLRARSRFIAR